MAIARRPDCEGLRGTSGPGALCFENAGRKAADLRSRAIKSDRGRLQRPYRPYANALGSAGADRSRLRRTPSSAMAESSRTKVELLPGTRAPEMLLANHLLQAGRSGKRRPATGAVLAMPSPTRTRSTTRLPPRNGVLLRKAESPGHAEEGRPEARLRRVGTASLDARPGCIRDEPEFGRLIDTIKRRGRIR